MLHGACAASAKMNAAPVGEQIQTFGAGSGWSIARFRANYLNRQGAKGFRLTPAHPER
jgi:hypothetical protein